MIYQGNRSLNLIRPSLRNASGTSTSWSIKIPKNPRPHVFITEVPRDEGYFIFYIALRLPLSSDGLTIDKILTAEEFGDERGQLKEIFESAN